MAQVYWNLEADTTRPRLPILPTTAAAIPVPAKPQADYAKMVWAERVRTGALWNGAKTSGSGFRTQGARLVVLLAQELVRRASADLPFLEPFDTAQLTLETRDEGARASAAITFPDSSQICSAALPMRKQASSRNTSVAAAAPAQAASTHPVLVGRLSDVGNSYQPRVFDELIEAAWSANGDNRVWLRGAPGIGKTYSARRYMQQALSDRKTTRPRLLLWVDSADPQSTGDALAEAAGRLEGLIGTPPKSTLNPREWQITAMLAALAQSDWGWLAVLDNAAAADLIASGLIPSGSNPNGRVLLTTNSPASALAGAGNIVDAQIFSPAEADQYLANRLPRSTQDQRRTVAEVVSHHPLAASIAASTIETYHLAPEEWVEEFAEAARIDSAADGTDAGGYPTRIAQTWRLALNRAAPEAPDGVMERVALVAALQAPDGHPSWIWDEPEIVRWVSPENPLERRHGRPAQVVRLMETGVLEFRGDTWRTGRIGVHGLAARAIRESVSPKLHAELAALLLNAWLRRIAIEDLEQGPKLMRENACAIAATVSLNQQQALLAGELSSFGVKVARSPSAADQRHHQAVMKHADALLQTCRELDINLADQAKDHLARHELPEAVDAAKSAGLERRAQEYLDVALTMLRPAWTDPTASDESLRIALIHGVLLLREAGEQVEAAELEHRESAVLTRLISAESDSGKLIDLVARLNSILASDGDSAAAREVIISTLNQMSSYVDVAKSIYADLTRNDAESSLDTVDGRFGLLVMLLKLDQLAEFQQVGSDPQEESTRALTVEVSSLLPPGMRYRWELKQASFWARTERKSYAEDTIRTWAEKDVEEVASLSEAADNMLRWASLQAHSSSDGSVQSALERGRLLRLESVGAQTPDSLTEWFVSTHSVHQCLAYLAKLQFAGSDRPGAVRLMKAAVESIRANPHETLLQNEQELAGLLRELGVIYSTAGNRAGALEKLRESTSIYATLTSLDSNDQADSELWEEAVNSNYYYGLLLDAQGDGEAALNALRDGLVIAQGMEPSSLSVSLQTRIFEALGDAHLRLEQFEDASEAWKTAEDFLDGSSDAQNADSQELFKSALRHARSLAAPGAWALAEGHAQRALLQVERFKYQATLEDRKLLHGVLAHSAGLRDDIGAGLLHARSSVEASHQLAMQAPDDCKAQQNHAGTLLLLVDHEERAENEPLAIDALQRAERIVLFGLAMDGEDDWSPSVEMVEHCWLELGRPKEAEAFVLRAQEALGQK